MTWKENINLFYNETTATTITFSLNAGGLFYEKMNPYSSKTHHAQPK